MIDLEKRKYSIKKEREKIGATLLSLYENTALKTLANRINNINRIKEKNVDNKQILNNYVYEFEVLVNRHAGTETKFVMECVLNSTQFNEFIEKCINTNISLYNFKLILSILNNKFVYLTERYIKGSDSEKMMIISPLVSDIASDLNGNFHEYISNITKKAC